MALESLAPDQRAVLELVLRQGRSYSELAETLGIPGEAVRRRAHAGLDGLGAHDAPDTAERGRVADFLLGQLEGSERDHTLAMLSSSAPARAWASRVSEQLRPVARDGLPELPPAGEQAPAPRHGSSRLGGAVLLGSCAVLLAALVVWLVSRGDGAQSAATPARASRSPTSAPTPTPLAQIALKAVDGSKAEGLMQVNATRQGQLGIVVVARDVKPSPQGKAYAVWLTDARRKAFRVGFEDKQSGGGVGPKGTLAFSGPAPDTDSRRFTRALTRYDRLVISLESSDKTIRPASVVLSGSLKPLRAGGAAAAG